MSITRQQIVEIVSRRGYDISTRTLRYWEQVGQMPRAQREGTHVYHSQDVIPTVVMLAATRPRQMREMRREFGKKVTQMRIDNGTLILTIKSQK